MYNIYICAMYITLLSRSIWQRPVLGLGNVGVGGCADHIYIYKYIFNVHITLCKNRNIDMDNIYIWQIIQIKFRTHKFGRIFLSKIKGTVVYLGEPISNVYVYIYIETYDMKFPCMIMQCRYEFIFFKSF